MISVNKNILLKYSLLLFAFFPIIPNNLKGLPVIILLVVSLSHISKHKVNLKRFIINSSLYFTYLISLLYTSNLDVAFKKLETTLSIIIIPLIFYIILSKNKIDEKIKHEFMKLFVLSTSLFSSIIIVSIWMNSSIEYYKDFYSNKYRLIVESTPLIGQHPIYASIFLAVSLLFVIAIFSTNKEKLTIYKKTIFVFGSLINIILLIMLSSKGVILSLFLLVLIFLVHKAINSKKHIIYLMIVFVSLISLFVFNRRMNELIRPETYSSLNSSYSNSYRIEIYKCTFHVIKENWLLGCGIGDSQEALESCYINKGKLLLEKTYNSHNQYLDTWIKTGVIGFIVFILFLFYNLRIAKETENYILFGIIILYGFNFLTENILARQSGVILFYFLINFMAREKLDQN